MNHLFSITYAQGRFKTLINTLDAIISRYNYKVLLKSQTYLNGTCEEN